MFFSLSLRQFPQVFFFWRNTPLQAIIHVESSTSFRTKFRKIAGRGFFGSGKMCEKIPIALFASQSANNLQICGSQSNTDDNDIAMAFEKRNFLKFNAFQISDERKRHQRREQRTTTNRNPALNEHVDSHHGKNAFYRHCSRQRPAFMVAMTHISDVASVHRH